MNTKITITPNIASIDPLAWNRLAKDDPFISHEFLSALENSKSVGKTTGWQTAHLTQYSEGHLIGAMPLYIKSHSFGEYVFDHAFADAYERAGGEYYPKLLAATPFTPVTSNRILAKNKETTNALINAALRIGRTNQLSSLHINFSAHSNTQLANTHSEFLERHNVQYHFQNLGYRDFNDFLNTLTSSKRKTIRKERRAALSSDVKIYRKQGSELTANDWECFWHCYQNTGARKWGTPYLSRGFFDEISATMPHQIMMVMAYEDGRPIAAALNFFDKTRLLGRYWGTLVDYKFLHFELCYYQAMEFAIEVNLKTVEAGAQGEHKITRGYAPEITRSYHHFYHPDFQRAIGDFLQDERAEMAHYCNHARQSLPYKKVEGL